MSIMIKGMEMPQYTTKAEFGRDADGHYLCIVYTGNDTKNPDIFDVVELPTPHGRLIDADALREEWLENGENEYVYDTNSFLESIDNAPTIIDAEGVTE